MEQWNKEVEFPQWLKDLPGYQVQDWRAFSRKRINGHTDGVHLLPLDVYCTLKM